MFVVRLNKDERFVKLGRGRDAHGKVPLGRTDQRTAATLFRDAEAAALAMSHLGITEYTVEEA